MSKLNEYINKEHNYIKTKLLSGKSIGIRPWLIKEEKDFLFAVETQQDNTDAIIDECLKLGSRCVDSVELYEKLSRNDIVYLLSQLRKVSKSKKIEFTFRCVNNGKLKKGLDKCSDWVDFDEAQKKEHGVDGMGRIPNETFIELGTKDIKTKSFDKKPVTIDKVIFHIKEIPYKIHRDMEQQFVQPKKIELNKFNYNFVAQSIDKIEMVKPGDQENEIIDDFTGEELHSFLDNMGPEEFKKLSDGIGERLSTFTIDKKVKCPTCGYENEVVYEELFSLMIF